MKTPATLFQRVVYPLLLASLLGCLSLSASAAEAVGSLGISGGLCVQIGGGDTALAEELAGSGRFLVHVLGKDEKTVAEVRDRLGRQARYGPISAERWDAAGNLPYAENLVNLLLILQRPERGISGQEIKRVLCPNGVVLAAPGTIGAAELRQFGLQPMDNLPLGGAWSGARKPRPAEMDDWPNPRHGADGNAVSRDTLVGPPRRIRWIAAGESADYGGPFCAAGRNFYFGGCARDAFNGLRLWRREGVNPLAASDKLLFVATKDGFTALDAVTGATVHRYEGRGWSSGAIHDAGTVIVFDHGSLRAYHAKTAKFLWEHKAARPRGVVAADDTVAFVCGEPRTGGKTELVVLDKATGQIRWKRDDHPWLPKVASLVYYRGVLACEVSTLSDTAEGNAVQLVSAANGELLFGHAFDPAMGHQKQARPLFLGDRFWILHVGPGGTKNQPAAQISALDFASGKLLETFAADMNHCYPPVATPRYLFSGWLDATDLKSGQVTSCHITKAGCGTVQGWVPANGLLYTRPNHCGCWPMLRGYAALAPQGPADAPAGKPDAAGFLVEKDADPPAGSRPDDEDQSWPCYRHDAWRSGSTPAAGPTELKTLWSADLGSSDLAGPIAADCQENPFVRGPVTAPVVAGGLVCVARPEAHEVLALDAQSGRVRWRFVASGRVDTPPTLHRGLCLFGCRSGWVYCLRAHDGRLVWRLRAAPLDERIVAHGQLESPWPVPGSVLVVDNVAYFAAGRHALADGGIRVFAVEPQSGKIRWVQRLDASPSEFSGLDYECFDLLCREGDGVAMSRWVFDRTTGALSAKRHEGFARLDTGKGAAMVPRGFWCYAPKEVQRRGPDTLGQSLVVFRDGVLLGSAPKKQAVYRRDFKLESGEKFDPRWPLRYEIKWPSEILAANAAWRVDVFDEKSAPQTISALVLAGDRLYVAGSGGQLQVRSIADGKRLAQRALDEPLWDGMAAAGGRLYVSTRKGHVVCLGKE